jgi:hypothetical protein
MLGSDSDEDKDATVVPESSSVTGRRRLTGGVHLLVAASVRARRGLDTVTVRAS